MTMGKVKKEEKAPEKDTADKETKEITFLCKFCGHYRPLEEMRVLTRFFPLLMVCRDCEEAMR